MGTGEQNIEHVGYRKRMYQNDLIIDNTSVQPKEGVLKHGAIRMVQFQGKLVNLLYRKKTGTVL